MTALTVALNQVNAYQGLRQGFDLTQPWTNDFAESAPVGLYGTGATLYPSILARRSDFRFADLTTALYDQRNLVRLRAMRVSMFAIPRGMLPAVFQATHSQVLNATDRFLKYLRITPEMFAHASDLIRAHLADRSLTAAEIKQVIAEAVDPIVAREIKRVIGHMCALGELVRARVRGTWKSDQTEYTVWSHWLPDVTLTSLEPQQAKQELARLYATTYGPVTVEDFRWWSGLNKADADAAMRSKSRDLVPVRIDGLPSDYWLLESDAADLLVMPDSAPQEVSLLPVWDAYLMAYRDRDRILPPHFTDRVYDGSGNATSTVLIGGRVAGVWDMEDSRQAVTVKVALFSPAQANVWPLIRQAAQRLADAVYGKGSADLHLLRCPSPPSLLGAPQNQFHHPLQHMEGEKE